MFESIKCPICNKQYKGLISLSYHCKKSHNLNSKDIFLKINNLDKEPTCACGCNRPVKFLGIKHGFRKYIRGHISRIDNNFHKNPETFQKSLKKRKQMIKDGIFKPFISKETGEYWNKGLTKETDERIANRVNAFKNNTEGIKRISERLSRNRKNGVVPTLYGKDHSQWNGGVSTLYRVCYSNNKLYKEWKYPKLKAANFTCSKCLKNNINNNPTILEIHHNDILMSEIVKKIAIEYNWEYNIGSRLENCTQEMFELKQKIAEAVAQYHIDNNVSGIVLCKECHKKVHASYNF